MQYKTIVFELLKQRPALHERLRSSHGLMPTLEAMALELKAGHEQWMDTLARARPQSHPDQVGSEAMELALADLTGRLPAEDPSQTSDEADGPRPIHTSTG